MNIGSIPGYYYDEEKKKYFKIQAAHQLPQNTKYSKENVKKENRKAKRQKVEHEKQAKRHQHTVKRNPILQHAMTGGTGLLREQGSYTSSIEIDQRDAAIISQYRPSASKVLLPGSSTCPELHLTSATYIPSTQQMVTASRHAHTGVSALHVCQWDWDKSTFEMPLGCGFAAFHSSITSISVATNRDVPRVIACSRQNSSTGQMFVSTIPSPDSTPTWAYQQAGIYFNVSNSGDNKLVSCVHGGTGLTAVSTANAILVLTEDTHISHEVQLSEDEPRIGVDWLSPNTVAYGINSEDSSDHHVRLWDIRTEKGVVSRFKVRKRITGLLNPSYLNSSSSADGNQLLVSTNHLINLYDTRMSRPAKQNDKPLLSFKHIHQGPELDLTTDGQNLIAAVDRDNLVKVFSMRTGRQIDSLAPPSSNMQGSESRMLTGLQWYDDPKVGSALQACQGNYAVRWTWGGSQDEEG